MTGPEKLKLFKNIKISSLLPNSQNNGITQQIWDDFSAIAKDLKHDFKLDEVKSFKLKVTNWLTKFLILYQTKDVTPYMHTLC